MTDANKRIEMVANVAIALVAILLGGILVRNHFFPSRHSIPDPRLQPGTKISLSDIDWESNGHTVLLVLTKECDLCSQSAPFYRQFVEQTASGKNFQLIAVLPQELRESQQYLDSLGITVDGLRQASLTSMGVKATPMVVLIDNTGIVTDSWVGKMTGDKASELFGKLNIR